MKILVTGAAGFIGSHLAARLASDGHEVVGLDNFNDYYSVALKRARVEAIAGVRVHTVDMGDLTTLEALFAREGFSHVVHLAAQAGVRHSVTHPHLYGRSNLTGFLNLLDLCQRYRIGHLLYASSSSVYGRQTRLPFRESDPVDTPASLYAATKRANEMMAYSYADLHRLASTGMRFFTVYGPWGRPDMAPCLFADRLLKGAPIDVFNHGQMARDFTYIDDVIEAIVRLIPLTPSDVDRSPHEIYNIGRGRSEPLMAFIDGLADALGVEADKRYLSMQPGDIERTWADTRKLQQAIGYAPRISLRTGTARFVDWLQNHAALMEEAFAA